jgi:hypothetical protein
LIILISVLANFVLEMKKRTGVPSGITTAPPPPSAAAAAAAAAVVDDVEALAVVPVTSSIEGTTAMAREVEVTLLRVEQQDVQEEQLPRRRLLPLLFSDDDRGGLLENLVLCVFSHESWSANDVNLLFLKRLIST